jgi:protein-disulfide isomerase
LHSTGADPLADFQKRQFASSVSQTFANAEVTDVNLERITKGNNPSLGNPDAKVTIVEFVDWGCPYCRQEAPIVRSFLKAHPDRVHLILRDFPIPELHPQAKDAALAARCVFETSSPEVFWIFHDRLFATQNSHTAPNLRRYAKDAGVDLARYDECLVNPAIQKTIETSIEDGRAAGVNATPTFFFNGVRIPGAIDADSFEVIIQQAEAHATL